MNPIFFVGMLIAIARFWPLAKSQPLRLYLFALGAPVFFGYWLYSLHSRVQPNWIAPAVVPLLSLSVLYWERRWRDGAKAVTPWLAAGLVFGLVAITLFHHTNLIRRITRVNLPAAVDPLRRVRGISDLAHVTGEARRTLQATDRRETFIIASHYGLTGQITFYLPEARLGLPERPLVYVRTSPVPRNQFYFWPEYRYPEHRRGQNAIYVSLNDQPHAPPAELVAQFETITDLGIREIKVDDQVFHRIQLYACRKLR